MSQKIGLPGEKPSHYTINENLSMPSNFSYAIHQCVELDFLASIAQVGLYGVSNHQATYDVIHSLCAIENNTGIGRRPDLSSL